MIDLHCHFLPGVDDGPRTLDEALTLAAASVANGITKAVMTPHVYPEVFDNTLATLAPVFSRYQEALEIAGIPLQILLGGEVRLHADIFQLLAAGQLPEMGRLDGKRIVLLELPDAHIPVGALESCKRFSNQGFRPMIAHPERNKEVMRDPMRIKPFVDTGCLLQVTAASIIGRFGASASDAAHRLLSKGMVAAVATDAHNMAHRPPLLREARVVIEQRYGTELAYRLTEETPASIVCSQPGQ